jgi:hypothetical protein
MSEDDVDKFETGRSQMGMSKSAYVRLLIAEHENAVPGFIKYKEIIEKLSSIELELQALSLKETLSPEDRMVIHVKRAEIEDLITKKLKG